MTTRAPRGANDARSAGAERREDLAVLERAADLRPPLCEAARPESINDHRLPDGSTPPAVAALRWLDSMSCCGHPVIDAGAMQLLCSTCVGFVFAATYSCLGCGATGLDPVGWFLAPVVSL